MGLKPVWTQCRECKPVQHSGKEKEVTLSRDQSLFWRSYPGQYLSTIASTAFLLLRKTFCSHKLYSAKPSYTESFIFPQGKMAVNVGSLWRESQCACLCWLNESVSRCSLMQWVSLKVSNLQSLRMVPLGRQCRIQAGFQGPSPSAHWARTWRGWSELQGCSYNSASVIAYKKCQCFGLERSQYNGVQCQSHLYSIFCEWGASDQPGCIKQPPDREQAGRAAATPHN